MKLLVTGGCGFIGCNFIRHILRAHPDWKITNLDLLTYAGNPDNVKDIAGLPGYSFVRGDICDTDLVDDLLSAQPDAIVNFAAESHVDRTILEPDHCFRTNALGTQNLLHLARRHGISRYIQISTDEVYGTLSPQEPAFTELSPLSPNSPYSGSKAAGDILARVAFHTYKFPAIITRCSNNYGPFQYPEKLIPLFVSNLMEDKPVPLYGDGHHVRDWIHVDDHVTALEQVLLKGVPGEVYNIGGDCELSNLQLTEKLLEILGRPRSLIQFVSDRPGHDRRYAMNSAKIKRELGWQPAHSFDSGLRATVQWYRDHSDWWRNIKSGAYKQYYEKQYGTRS